MPLAGDFPAGDVLKTRLGEVAGVTDLVGAPPADRIYKFMTPEKPSYPAVVYRQISARRLTGTYGDPGVAFVTVQLVILAQTMDGAHALDKQVRLALERFGSDQPAGTPYAGTTLYDITVGSSADGYADDAQCFYVTTDYTLMLEE